MYCIKFTKLDTNTTSDTESGIDVCLAVLHAYRRASELQAHLA